MLEGYDGATRREFVTTVLIVGAGFSLDANSFIGAGDRPYSRGYPLVGQLAKACFPLKYDLTAGVEAAFEEATRRGDHEPVARLVELIEEADYSAGYPVARAA